MKGFIEVTATGSGNLTLINVSSIIRIANGTIFLNQPVSGGTQTFSSVSRASVVESKHTYEELKAKIEEATQ